MECWWKYPAGLRALRNTERECGLICHPERKRGIWVFNLRNGRCREQQNLDSVTAQKTLVRDDTSNSTTP